jgi:hypothetical protein
MRPERGVRVSIQPSKRRAHWEIDVPRHLHGRERRISGVSNKHVDPQNGAFA